MPATSTPSVSGPTAQRTSLPTTSAPTPVARDLEFVRWLSREIPLVLAPGSDIVTATTSDEPLAAVLERRVIDGLEWIKVQVGRGYAQDFVATGWAPLVADITTGGQTIHIDPVYEPIVPDCPQHAPTLGDLDAMLPLQSLYCFGSGTLTFAPVVVRVEGSEEEAATDGTPHWLTEGGTLVGYWMPQWKESGSIRLFVDPISGIEIGDGIWVEVSGHLNDSAAQTCTRTSQTPPFMLPDPADAVPLCQGRFVVTAVRRLTEAEIPARPDTQTPGPPASTEAQVTVREFEAPIANREGPATVWTGTEMVVWGGFDITNWRSQPALDDGAAYAPSTSTWRPIPKGPLSPRAYALSAWTGNKMLIWGGQRSKRDLLGDGAEFDPASNTWREIAKAPITWAPYHGSVWTGTEWWVAALHGGKVDVAAYDPSADTWRTLPSVTEDYSEHPQLVWTGTEVIMKSPSGLYRISPSGSAWTHVSVQFNGPMTFADSLLYGMRFVNASTDPLGWEPFSYPITWDPVTGTTNDVPPPPSSVYSPVWTGTYLAYFKSNLALDVRNETWIRLNPSEDVIPALDRDGAAQVWAGDRLIQWAGTDGCGPLSGDNGTGYELIPAWPTGVGTTTEIGVARSSGAGGGAIALAC